MLTQHGQAIGPNGIAVYWALKAFAQGKGRCHPSRETIARLIGTSVATVKRTLPLLVKAGLVRIEPRYANNRQTVSVYHLLPVEKDERADDGRVYPLYRDFDYDPALLHRQEEAEQLPRPVIAYRSQGEKLTAQAMYADIAAVRQLNRDFLQSLVDDETPEPDAADLWGQAAD